MKAMDLVAASKLQKAKARLDVVRPLYEDIRGIMDDIQTGEGTEGNVFVMKREVKNAAYVIITSDRGLCGGYNLNVSKEALAFMNAQNVPEKIVSIGIKGNDFFRRRGKNVIERIGCSTETAFYLDAEHIAGLLVKMYLTGEVDEVYVVYTHFETILAHVPTIFRLLPVGSGQSRGDGGNKAPERMVYDPDANTFMTYAVPMYMKLFLYGAMIESVVCEQASRMTSMDAATRNAEDIIEDLTLVYNRKRQGAITQEITEIVSGANALK
jgi:F-type H+-transporting ATPase subunit gamma